MILKNLLTNTYYISPEIIILFGIFVATLTGVFIKKNSVGTTCNLVILTFIISVYQILSIGKCSTYNAYDIGATYINTPSNWLNPISFNRHQTNPKLKKNTQVEKWIIGFFTIMASIPVALSIWIWLNW